MSLPEYNILLTLGSQVVSECLLQMLQLQVLHMMACWAEDPTSDSIKFHLARVPDYLWVAEDGMKMQVW